MSKTANEKKAFWLQLDNAAKIFPGQNSRTWSNTFRVCYELNEKIDPARLERALKDIMPRFPCYDVQIRHGFFWFYLEHNERQPEVRPDINNPCFRTKFKEDRHFLFRVYYHGCRIAVDMYHVLSDGHGGTMFITSLVAQYLRLNGADIPAGRFVLLPGDTAGDTELEDAFVKNATSRAKYKRADKFVYHAKGTRLPPHTLKIISGTMDFESLHAITKPLGVTVTEYLAALMLRVLIDRQKRDGRKQKEVSIQVPVDLRRAFGSDTLRNFTICLRVKIDPNRGEYTFDELLTQVKYQLRLVNNRNDLNMMISANMGLERNFFIRALPLFIKNIGVSVSFMITAEQTTSCLLTNLGRVDIPEEMAPFVNKFILMPGPGKVNGTRIGAATVNGKLVVTFADIYEESDIERDFFTSLVRAGVRVKIESNMNDGD